MDDKLYRIGKTCGDVAVGFSDKLMRIRSQFIMSYGASGKVATILLQDDRLVTWKLDRLGRD